MRKNTQLVEDRIPIKNVLLSVFDKNGLDNLINGLLEIEPEIRLFSTGGTGVAVLETIAKRNG